MRIKKFFGRRVVLGAADPEMSLIEAAARAADLEVVYATAPGRDGQPARVGGPSTYKATAPAVGPDDVWVETAPAVGGKAAIKAAGAVLVDHHEVGDPGYGAAPTEALAASSLGQFMALLGRELTHAEAIAAACDHCLTAAVKGLVPGISGEEVITVRVATAAQFEKRTVEALEAEIRSALEAIAKAPRQTIGGVEVADLRAFTPPAEADPKSDRGGVASLHHAGPMTGQAYISLVREKSGRLKCVLGGDGPGTATEGKAASGFAAWAIANGYVDAYGGDPARGFAGAYAP